MGRFQYGIEEYAIKNRGRLHPLLVDQLMAHGSFPESVLMKVRLVIKDSLLFTMSGRRGGSTPAFVMGRTIYMRPGVLNQPPQSGMNNFDLSTPKGFATFAHEVFHVRQFLDRGWRWLIWQIIRGGFRSQIASGIWWDHAVIPMEQEAIEFATKVEAGLDSRQLSVFTLLR